LEASKAVSAGLTVFKLFKLQFDLERGTQLLREVGEETWQLKLKGPTDLELTFDLTPGYYLLFSSEGHQPSALPIIVTDRSAPAEVAVIRPVFTQWSYHSKGFYFNEYRSPSDRLLMRVGGLGKAGRLAERALRQSAGRLRIPKINFPYGPFPAHASISLRDFYRRNNRWDRLLWDKELGRLEGLWVDEVLSGMPIFALLDKNSVPYHVFTDVDLHNQNPALSSYSVLIFSGQEGITPAYHRTLQSLQAARQTSFLLWGVQAFGYRQLAYDAETGELAYVGTRGSRGMWGDQLEGHQPEWGDEGNLFGFHFPEPESASWRYDKPYARIVVKEPEHPIVRRHRQSADTYHYEVRDLAGASHPGLTWAGGEVQQRVAPGAGVIAHLDDDEQIIGIGEYRNTVIFSPTYLPAFFAYQSREHPEIEEWFMNALDYLRRVES
jgi:hypothetical protein